MYTVNLDTYAVELFEQFCKKNKQNLTQNMSNKFMMFL